jgi:alanine racemase
MSRKTFATINLSAIKHNYLYAKSCVPSAYAVAIVKANAYGHGAVNVAKYLDGTVDLFGVACLEEAIEIRQSGVRSPIASSKHATQNKSTVPSRYLATFTAPWP